MAIDGGGIGILQDEFCRMGLLPVLLAEVIVLFPLGSKCLGFIRDAHCVIQNGGGIGIAQNEVAASIIDGGKVFAVESGRTVKNAAELFQTVQRIGANLHSASALILGYGIQDHRFHCLALLHLAVVISVSAGMSPGQMDGTS